MQSWKKAMDTDPKDKFVFSHVPIYANDFLYFTMQNSEERNKIISACAKDRAKFFIDGHTHQEIVSDFGKFTEYNLPGFLEKYGYTILHVNEATKETSLKCLYY